MVKWKSSNPDFTILHFTILDLLFIVSHTKLTFYGK